MLWYIFIGSVQNGENIYIQICLFEISFKVKVKNFVKWHYSISHRNRDTVFDNIKMFSKNIIIFYKNCILVKTGKYKVLRWSVLFSKLVAICIIFSEKQNFCHFRLSLW